MLLKIVAVGAILLFVTWVVAVLQGWSKSPLSQRLIGVGFIFVFGLAAAWGVRVLGLFRW